MTKELFKYSENYYNEASAKNTLPIIFKHLPKIKRVIDFGCGNGAWLSVLKKEYNCDILGIDNQQFRDDFLISRTDFATADITQPYSDATSSYDLAICLEVGEHIPTEKANGLIKNLTNASDYILFSAAIPMQGGSGHVNEVWSDFWAHSFRKYDYFPLDIIRPLIWNNSEILYYYRQNIVLFCRTQSALLHKYREDHELRQYNSYVHPELYKIKAVKANDWDREVLLKSRTLFRKIMDRIKRKF